MTPAEVIAMRDELAGDLRDANDSDSPDIRFKELADWLIGSGWVTNEPKENVLDCKREEESK